MTRRVIVLAEPEAVAMHQVVSDRIEAINDTLGDCNNPTVRAELYAERQLLEAVVGAAA